MKKILFILMAFVTIGASAQSLPVLINLQTVTIPATTTYKSVTVTDSLFVDAIGYPVSEAYLFAFSDSTAIDTGSTFSVTSPKTLTVNYKGGLYVQNTSNYFSIAQFKMDTTYTYSFVPTGGGATQVAHLRFHYAIKDNNLSRQVVVNAEDNVEDTFKGHNEQYSHVFRVANPPVVGPK